ncbi:MAG TPA: murein biosynthesis integral membrane protein MurJ [Rhizomicrobium sp.]
MLGRLLSVGGYTALSRVAGFIRDILMAKILGANAMSDAFFVAFRLPNNFRAIFAEGAFNLAFLPRYAAMRERDGHEAAGKFANRVYSWQMITQVVLLLAALGAMRPIISIMAPGFAAHPGQLELATSLARIAFPYLIFTVVAVQLSAMLNAVGKFAAAAAWSIFLNIAMIAALCCAPFFPNAAYAAAWGVFAAGILQLVFIIWAGARSHLRLKFERPRWTPEIKQFLIALGAATFGSASVQIGLFIDNVIASFLPSGDLTALYYADRINQLPMGTLGIAIGTVLLPEMSSLLAKNDRKGADEAQNRSAALALFLTLPFVAAFLTVPLTIMQGLFAHGAFHLQAAQISAMALMAYGIGLPAFVLIRCVSPAFYARGDTATPVRATIAAVAVNIALKIALVWGAHLGATGIALGTSLAAWVNVGVLVMLARSRGLLTIDSVFKRSLPPTFLATIATGAGAVLGVWLGGHLHFGSGALADEVSLACAVLCGGAGFAAVTLVFRHALPLGRLARRRK